MKTDLHKDSKVVLYRTRLEELDRDIKRTKELLSRLSSERARVLKLLFSTQGAYKPQPILPLSGHVNINRDSRIWSEPGREHR